MKLSIKKTVLSVFGLFALLACPAKSFSQKSAVSLQKGKSLRAPAYPLVTHNPYFSIWSMGDELNATPIQHWTGADKALIGIVKGDDQYFRFLGAESRSYKTLLPASDEAEDTAAYSESKPAENWTKPDFDDSSWEKGAAPFGDDTSKAKTVWMSKDLWYRQYAYRFEYGTGRAFGFGHRRLLFENVESEGDEIAN